MRCAHGGELGLRLRCDSAALGGRGRRRSAQTQSASTANKRRCLMAQTSRFAYLGRKHTSLVPAAILARPKKPESLPHAATVRVHWPSSLPCGRAVLAALAVDRGELRERMSGIRRAVLHAGGAAHESGRAGDRSARQGGCSRRATSAMRATCRRRSSTDPADTLKKWRDKTVITYCDSGVSGAARRAHLGEARLHQGFQSRRAD